MKLRPPDDEIAAALRATNGSVTRAAELLATPERPLKRNYLLTILTRAPALQRLAADLRAAAKPEAGSGAASEAERCKWRGCHCARVTKAFCRPHAEHHNANVATKIEDRKQRGVCVICEGELAATSTRLCDSHLEAAREASKARRSRTGNGRGSGSPREGR